MNPPPEMPAPVLPAPARPAPAMSPPETQPPETPPHEARPPETPPPDSSLSYARAVQELEAILAELEDDNLDVDHLAERVARAAALVRLCRERITGTRMEVERIVADLDGGPAPEPPG